MSGIIVIINVIKGINVMINLVLTCTLMSSNIINYSQITPVTLGIIKIIGNNKYLNFKNTPFLIIDRSKLKTRALAHAKTHK